MSETNVYEKTKLMADGVVTGVKQTKSGKSYIVQLLVGDTLLPCLSETNNFKIGTLISRQISIFATDSGYMAKFVEA